MLLNIRGTHGSGKTYISHKLMETYGMTPVIEPAEVLGKTFRKPNCHVIEGMPNLNIVGRYKSGMDGIFPQEIVEMMIEHWAGRGHMIWENIVVSANIGRWAELSRKLEPINHNIWLFMDTPLQTCIDRVFQRRHQAAAQGFNHRQDDSEVKLDVLAGHWRRVRRAAARAYLEGIDVRWVDHTCSYEQVLNLLTVEGGWKPTPDYNAYVESRLNESLNVPQLLPWKPSEEELEYVLKTSRLPWGDPNEQTTVDFVSPKKIKSSRPLTVDALGSTVLKWDTGEPIANEVLAAPEATTPTMNDVFGSTVLPWSDTINLQENNEDPSY